MHSDYNDWEPDIPISVQRAMARAEMAGYDYTKPENLAERRRILCETCEAERAHTELPSGMWQCCACGSENPF